MYSSVPLCCSKDHTAALQPCLGTKATQILQAQPRTLLALQQVAITLISVFPSFVPWPHKSITSEHKCFVLYVLIQLRCMRGFPPEKENCQLYINFQVLSRHNKFSRPQPPLEKICRIWLKEPLERTENPMYCWYLYVSRNLGTSSSPLSVSKVGWTVPSYLKVRLSSGYAVEFYSMLKSVKSSFSSRRPHATTSSSYRIIKTCHSG